MRRFGARVCVMTLVALALAACGGEDGGAGPDGGGGGKPLAVTVENLGGYWIADGADVPLWRPIFLHFGPGNVATEEALAGGSGRRDRGRRRAHQPGALPLGGGRLVSAPARDPDRLWHLQLRDHRGPLTKDTLEIQFSHGRSERLTFRRVEGCGAPGLWFGPSEFRVVDAAWGPDGALHMLSVDSAELGDLSGYYHWIPPGRCTPYVPPVSIIGDSIDVGDEGTIRIVQVDEASPLGPGGVTLVKIERAPWNRPQLDPTITTLTTALSTAAVRPATRAIALPDGRTLALWADGRHAARVGGEVERQL
jgi:hypothetical protein